MKFIPAIDILDGRAVRLRRGDYGDVTDYGDPLDVAERWAATGVTAIHVVDLEAARGGERQAGVLRRLGATGVSFQLGGGIRTAEDALLTLDLGASAVVVGSAFTAKDGRAEEIVGEFGGDAVVAAVDVRGGRARGQGWTDEGSPLQEVIERVSGLGVTTALVTGIERDGMLTGPDIGLLEQVHDMAPNLDLIASGGVASLEDLRELTGLPGVTAVVSGRALFESCFTVEEALAVEGVIR